MAQNSRKTGQNRTTGTGSRTAGTRTAQSGARKTSAAGRQPASRQGSNGRTAGTGDPRREESSASRRRSYERNYEQDRYSRRPMPEEPSGRDVFVTDLVLILTLSGMVFIALSNFGLMGAFGRGLSGVIFGLFGFSGYLLPLFVIGIGVYYFLRREDPHLTRNIICMVILFFVFGVLYELIAGHLADTPSYSITGIYKRCSDADAAGRRIGNGGGVLAGSLAFFLYHYLRMVGTLLVLVVIVLVCALVLSGRSLVDLFEGAGDEAGRRYADARAARGGRVDYRGDAPEDRYRDPEALNYGDDPESAEDAGYRYERDAAGAMTDSREGEEDFRDAYRSRAEREEADEDARREARRRARIEEKEERRRAFEEARRKEREERDRRAAERRAEEEARRKAEAEAEEERIRKEREARKLHREEAENDAILRRADAYSGSLQETTLYPADGTNPAGEGAGLKPPVDGTVPAAGMEAAQGTGTAGTVSAGAAVTAAAASGSTAAGAETAGSVVEDGDYSTSADLHEIRAREERYAAIGAAEDEKAAEEKKEELRYSGIGIPRPQETNPDYASDDFAQRIIRQGVTTVVSGTEQGAEPAAAAGTADAEEPGKPAEAAGNKAPFGDIREVRPAGEAPVPEKNPNVQNAGVYNGTPETVPALQNAGESSRAQETAPASLNAENPAASAVPVAAVPSSMPALPDTVNKAGDQRGEIPAAGNGAAADKDTAETAADEKNIEKIDVQREKESADKGESIFRAPGQNRTSTSGMSFTDPGAKKPEPEIRKQPFRFPPMNLLHSVAGKHTEESDRELKETAYRLQETLKTFGVDVTIPQVSQGPAVTRYELLPAQGVKVSRIVSLADDIKLNLAAADIRIEAPIPGKRAIGIEVPNRNPQSVPLRDLFESEAYRGFRGRIPFAVGKNIGGDVVVHDLTKMPHVLIAGATGSGKSVCINTLIMSILYSRTPDEVKLILIDPKIVELSVYNGIPHLLLPVVTDPKQASSALQWAVTEMSARYQMFAEEGVRDLKGYNQKARETSDGRITPMPQIVIIVDELADLMMVCGRDVEDSICRLAQLARAAGIHLVIATQRPSVDVITGLIKANMPSRIAFAVSSGVDSRTILDQYGAEKLLGKGDMLFDPQGYPKPARIQGAFVSDEEVQDVANYIRYHNPTWKTDDSVEAKVKSLAAGESSPNAGPEDSGGSAGPDIDEHFVEAGYIIIEKQKASIGMLQRVFKIGFNRAARIMDQLAEAGVVSEDEGTKARRILMSKSDFESYIEENGL